MPQVAVVTGASSGVGAALAKQLAEAGVIVYAVARRGDQLAEVQRSCSFPDNIRIIPADLSTGEGINTVLETLAGQRIDFLVNNAAILGVKALAETKYDELVAMFQTNIIAPTFLTSQLSKQFAKDGRIINISSRAAFSFSEGLATYSMTKAGINVLSATAAAELFPTGRVLVTSFVPGEVDTAMQADLRAFPPLAAAFTTAQASGQLISPALSAQCLTWMLLGASPAQFTSAVSIYNKAHHAEWLRPDQVIPEPQAGMTGLAEEAPTPVAAVRVVPSSAAEATFLAVSGDTPDDARHCSDWTVN